MDKLYEQSETGCCPRFNPEPWDEKEISWQDRLFLKDRVRSFLHIPLNFGKVMVKNLEKRTLSGGLIFILRSPGKFLTHIWKECQVRF